MPIKFPLLVFLFFITPILIFAVDGVEINTASLQELDALIGVGPMIGQKIIDARPFSSVDDLLRVKGIGEKTLQKIKDRGLAYVENSTGEIASPSPSDSARNDASLRGGETDEAISILQVSQEVRPPESTSEVGPPPSYPVGIVLNEILPSPAGPDEQNEWIVPTIQPIVLAYL